MILGGLDELESYYFFYRSNFQNSLWTIYLNNIGIKTAGHENLFCSKLWIVSFPIFISFFL
jgi:hypothetical protein